MVSLRVLIFHCESVAPAVFRSSACACGPGHCHMPAAILVFRYHRIWPCFSPSQSCSLGRVFSS